jgi:serine/threonine-protein kinase
LLTQTRGDRTVDPLIGTTLDGRYCVQRVLGEGGMGIVYEAEHALIERRVAIKVLREDFCRRSDVVERFRREAKSASRIGHPNIVDVLDFGETPTGASYFVMEMLEGEDLADQLARSGALSPERAVLIMYQCCNALSAAHDKAIVHRDLKPENIFLIERNGAPDFVKLVDFGVAKMNDPELDLGRRNDAAARAKLTRTGMIFGTPEYMSPEQATGLVPDHRVDIYALGVTLYELLTGRVPFEGDSFMSVLSKHANKQVPALRDVNPRVKVSPELEQVVFRALRKNRDERFQTMHEMTAQLQNVPEMPALPFRVSLPSSPGVARSPVPRSPLATPLTSLGTPLPIAPSAPALFVPSLRVRKRKTEVALLAIAAALGLVLYAAIGRGGADSMQPRATSTVAAPQAPTAPKGSGLKAVAQSSPEAPALELVSVRVTTQPAGARVRLAGGGEVCGSTPCSFDAVRGAPISLQAYRAGRQGVATLNPTAATELHLVLEPQLGKTLSPSASSGDLKVPKMFRDPAK